jgi:hypothetical protein
VVLYCSSCIDSSKSLQRLHDSEINGALIWFFDGGFGWLSGLPAVSQEEPAVSLVLRFLRRGDPMGFVRFT